MCNCSSSNCGCINSSVLPIGPAGTNGTNGTTLSLGLFDNIPNVNGLTLMDGVSPNKILNLEPASALFPGGVSTGTQTFAGEKTFNAFSETLEVGSFGVGIGASATDKTFLPITKSFTSPINTQTQDTGLSLRTTFTYSGSAGSESTSKSLLSFVTASGDYSPYLLVGAQIVSSNNLNYTTTLGKSIVVIGTNTSGFPGNTTLNIGVGFLESSNSNKATGNLTTINTNYSFYAALPYLGVGASPSIELQIGTQYGFFCEDYGLATVIPIMSSTVKNAATLGKAWQLYLSGRNLTSVGSYIGHRLGVGFGTQPTDTTDVTALLHIGAGVTSSAQLRLSAGVAPTTPNNGDIWFDGTDIKMRIAGVTKTFTLV